MKIDSLKPFQYLPQANNEATKAPAKTILGGDNINVTSSQSVDETIPEPLQDDKIGRLISGIYNFLPPQMPKL